MRVLAAVDQGDPYLEVSRLFGVSLARRSDALREAQARDRGGGTQALAGQDRADLQERRGAPCPVEATGVRP